MKPYTYNPNYLKENQKVINKVNGKEYVSESTSSEEQQNVANVKEDTQVG